MIQRQHNRPKQTHIASTQPLPQHILAALVVSAHYRSQTSCSFRPLGLEPMPTSGFGPDERAVWSQVMQTALMAKSVMSAHAVKDQIQNSVTQLRCVPADDAVIIGGGQEPRARSLYLTEEQSEKEFGWSKRLAKIHRAVFEFSE
jgi:hypothetical protein